MPKQLFACEKCGSVHQIQENAELCEAKHLEPSRQQFIYVSKDAKSKYPKEVKLWFSASNILSNAEQCVTFIRHEDEYLS